MSWKLLNTIETLVENKAHWNLLCVWSCCFPCPPLQRPVNSSLKARCQYIAAVLLMLHINYDLESAVRPQASSSSGVTSLYISRCKTWWYIAFHQWLFWPVWRVFFHPHVTGEMNVFFFDYKTIETASSCSAPVLINLSLSNWPVILKRVSGHLKLF